MQEIKKDTITVHRRQLQWQVSAKISKNSQDRVVLWAAIVEAVLGHIV